MASWTTQRSGNWSTDASNGSSPWNGGSNPASGVPADGDTVTIAGHTITFDVDQSGFTNGLASLTLNSNSTLQASTSTGNYYLKMQGSIAGAASATGSQILAGSVGTPYPTDCVFTIYFSSSGRIDCTNGITVKFYCYEPTTTYVRVVPTPNTARVNKAITAVTSYNPLTLTVPSHGYSVGDVVKIMGATGLTEIQYIVFYINSVPDSNTVTLKWYDSGIAVNASDADVFTPYTSGGYLCIHNHTSMNTSVTVWNVDTDVSADPEWNRAGAVAGISYGGRTAAAYHYLEVKTISAITSSTITLSSTVTNARGSSAIIVLGTRNVRIRQSTVACTYGLIYRGSGHVLRCEITPTAGNSILHTATSSSIIGGAYNGIGVPNMGGSTQGLITSCTSITVSGGSFFGCNWQCASYPFAASSVTVTGGLYTGLAYFSSGTGTVLNVQGGLITHNRGIVYYTGIDTSTISGGSFICNYVGICATNSTISGLLMAGNAYCLSFIGYNGWNNKITGGKYLGNRYVISGGSIIDISNIVVYGSVGLQWSGSRGGDGSQGCDGILKSGEIRQCISGLRGMNMKVLAAEFSGNTQDLFCDTNSYLSMVAYRTKFLSGTKFTGYKQTNVPAGVQAILYDRDEGSGYRAGFHAAWMPGGYVITTDGSATTTNGWTCVAFLDSANKPAAVTSAHTHTCDIPVGLTAGDIPGYPVWFDIPFFARANIPVAFTIYWCKSSNSMIAIPQAQIYGADQAFSDTPLASITMANNTTWQTALLSYTPTYDQPLILRVRGADVSGTTFQWQAIRRVPPLGMFMARMAD